MTGVLYQSVALATDVWMTVNPRPIAPPGVEAKVTTVLSWLFWIGVIAVIAGLIIGFIKLAVANGRGEAAENMKGIGITIISGIGISAASGIAWVLVR